MNFAISQQIPYSQCLLRQLVQSAPSIGTVVGLTFASIICLGDARKWSSRKITLYLYATGVTLLALAILSVRYSANQMCK